MSGRLDRAPVLITGGAGFVGTNLAEAHLSAGIPVHVYDNLSRSGVSENVRYLQGCYGTDLQFTQGDVRDQIQLSAAVRGARAVYHLAAQVAVTTSLHDPLDDLGTNLLGTVNVLEAIRASGARPPLVFTSTNKVYGKLQGVALTRRETRWEPQERHLAQNGIDESQALAFLSPYGCSKGSADQYVLDYASSFGLPAAVFRMSCIYGPFQLGSEDQGWVAHFLRQTMKGEPVTIYGDGYQVRDLLFVDDLVDAMQRAVKNMSLAAGHAFNLGGGYSNSISLVELIKQIERLTSEPVETLWSSERLADQRWYIANAAKAQRVLGWSPRTSVATGLRRLYEWYQDRPELVSSTRKQEAQLA